MTRSAKLTNYHRLGCRKR